MQPEGHGREDDAEQQPGAPLGMEASGPHAADDAEHEEQRAEDREKGGDVEHGQGG